MNIKTNKKTQISVALEPILVYERSEIKRTITRGRKESLPESRSEAASVRNDLEDDLFSRLSYGATVVSYYSYI